MSAGIFASKILLGKTYLIFNIMTAREKKSLAIIHSSPEAHFADFHL